MMIEYEALSHTYYSNGQIVPSVTQILSKLFPTKYQNVPDEVLQKAAAYGTKVHALIEEFNKGSNIATVDLLINGINYEILLQNNAFTPLAFEEIVYYTHDNTLLYAGRYDLLAIDDDKKIMVDIKTTSQLDKTMLSYQLTMYALAYEQMTTNKIDYLGCMWLPKNKVGQYVKVERLDTDKLIEEILAL